MKVEYIEDGLRIFLQNCYFDKIDWENKEQVSTQIKKIFLMISKNYHVVVSGLYRVKVYPNKFGVMIVAIKLDNQSYGSSDFDLRIFVCLDKELYFKFDDYYLLENLKLPYFYKDGYYVNVNDVNDIINCIEFCNLISSDEILIN